MLFLFFIFSTQGILDTSRLPVNLGAMYFMVTMHTNPVTGVYSGYYRLVESYRDPRGRVCHRTILNASYLYGLTS